MRQQALTFQVRKMYKQLRPSEQKVADTLLTPGFDITDISIEGLSKLADVSQPTIIRFANALGLKGFKELKRKLLDEMLQKDMTQQEMVTLPVLPEDKLIDIPAKVIQTNIKHLQDTLKSLSSYELIRAIQAITKAKTVALFAVENSSCVAEDLKTKLIYMGINALHYLDPHLQTVSAKNLTPNDVAIGISYTGFSGHTVDSLRMAKESGATTMAVTNSEKVLLNKYADIVLCTESEQYFCGNTIFSRGAQIAIVDMLYAGILLTDYNTYATNIEENGIEISRFAYKTEAL